MAFFDRLSRVMTDSNLRLLGDDASYIATGRAPVSLRVWLIQDVRLQVDGYDAQAWAPGVTIEARMSDFDREPNAGDVFVARGRRYTVQAVDQGDGEIFRMQVTG